MAVAAIAAQRRAGGPTERTQRRRLCRACRFGALNGVRIDKFLWFVRLAKSRSAAQALICEGHIRLNRRRIERAAAAVVVGDVLTLPRGLGVLVIEITGLPARRGPAAEAQACYLVLDEARPNPIAAGSSTPPEGTFRP